MHSFGELVDSCARSTLDAMGRVHSVAADGLQKSAEMPLIKALQIVKMQKAIVAVGMFSLFEAWLQDQRFRKAADILDRAGDIGLRDRFKDLRLAINVLKHGRGHSYEALVARATGLSFKIRLPEEAFFAEGDVSEIATLIDVDDAFVLECADVISRISDMLR